MESLNRTRRKLKGRFDDKQTVSHAVSALMGQGNGTVEVPNQPGYVYFRISGEAEYGIAFNNRCPIRDNLRIYVGYDPITDKNQELFQVLSVNMGDYAGDGGSSPLGNVGPHHVTHEFGGGDDVYIEWRRLMGLRVGRPALFVVTVDPGVIIKAGAHLYIPSTNVNLAPEHAALVGTQACYVLIYLDSAGVVQHLPGLPVASLAALTIANCPIAPGVGDFELAAVRLYVAQTRIGDTPTNPDIWDLRFPASAAWSSGNNWSLTGNASTIPVTNYLGTNDATDVVFATNSTERMRLSHADTALIIGDIAHGAGVIAGANTRLFTVGVGTAASQCVVIYGTGNPTHAGYKSQGTRAVPVVCNANDYLARFTGRGYSAGAWPLAANASIDLLADEIFTTNSGTRIEFCTTPTGSTTRAIHAILRFADFRVQYDAANYAAITPSASCGAITWSPEISGYVIVRSVTPNIVGGAFGATPGNARGTNAIDLQLSRAAAAQVASGNYAIISGGANNIASGTISVVIGGSTNEASGYGATCLGGLTNVAAGDYSITAGLRAKIAAAHDGAVLFAGNTDADFNSIATDEFAIRARGGLRHAYNDNNYVKFAVDSGGNWAATITHAAGTPVFSFDHTTITTTADSVCTAKFAGATGRLLIYGYYDATYGVILQALDTAETGYVPLTLYTSSPVLIPVGGLHVGGTSDPGINNVLVAGTATIVGAFGCNGVVAQTAYASGGALAAYGAGANGLDTEANMAALHAMVVAIRAALVANGIMS